jgi:O-antigen ligase
MTAAAHRHRKVLIVALLLFSFCLPISKSATTVLLTLVYAYVALVAVVNREFRQSLVPRLNQPLVIPFLAIVGVSIAGLVFTQNLSDGMGVVNKLVSLPLVYLLAAVLPEFAHDHGRQDAGTETALLAFIAGILILDCIGLLTYVGVIGQKKFQLPLAPLHVHHIWFANLNAVGLYAALSFLLFGQVRNRPKITALLAGFIVLAVFSILFSTSRTAWLGMLATGVVLSYLMARTKRYFLIAVAVAVAGCLLAYQFSAIFHDRVNSIYNDISFYAAGETYSSLGDRFVMWKAAFSMFLSNPLMGVGTGDYMATMREYVAAGTVPERILGYNQPHNMYLFALATNGVLGLAALLFLFLHIFKHVLPFRAVDPAHRQLSFLASAVAVHYLVAGLTDSLFNIFLLRYTFAFIMGLCVRESVKSELASR